MWEIHILCASELPQSAVKMSKTYMGWLAVNKVYYETLPTTRGTSRNIDLVKGNYYFKFSRNSVTDTGKYNVD